MLTFTQNLILQTLDSVPGLRTLRLTLSWLQGDSAELARMINHVRHLAACRTALTK
jgi:hypothetical protein